MSSVAIVDFRFGNLRSVSNALHWLCGDDAEVYVTDEAAGVDRAERVVFPGQGAARACMQELQRKDLAGAVLRAAREKPFLGICMGMQVLMERSDENDGVDCLGLVAGDVRLFPGRDERPRECKVPHMGWNGIRQHPHPLWQDIPDDSHFYFAHSYRASPGEDPAIAGTTEYAGIRFASAIASGPMFAMQSHPEKSGAHGQTLLRNFLRWDGTV